MSILGLFGKGNPDDKQPEQTPSKNNLPSLPLASKVLTLVDGSQLSYTAMNYAIAFASRVPCELYATFVIDTACMDVLQQMRIFVTEERESFEAELDSKGRRVLRSVREQGQAYGLEINTILMKGRIHQVVLQAIQELDIDLLVIGGWHQVSTRKDTASVERQLLLSQANCPVIIVKDNSRIDQSILL